LDQTQKLLESVVENARTGAEACEQLMARTKDAGVRDELMVEREQYQAIERDAERALYAAGGRPKAQSPMARASMWMGMELNTMLDASRSHVAEIAIQGNTMGVVTMTKERNSCPDADAEAHGLASNFIVHQQDAVERLKAFL